MGVCNSGNIHDYEEDEKIGNQKIDIPVKENILQDFSLLLPIYIQTSVITARRGLITKINKSVVVKKIKKTEGMEKMFIKEILILQKLDHPNIIKIFDYFQTKRYYYIIYPYFDGLPIIDYYLKNVSNFKIKEIKKFMQELLRTVHYLHSMGVTHRNLDAKNIIYNGEQLLICGFPKAAFFHKEKIRKSKKKFYKIKINNLYFVPPEVIKGNYDERNDIWVCGIIFYMLLTGNPPFQEDSEKLLEKSIIQDEIDLKVLQKLKIPQSGIDLITLMLTKDFNKRPNALSLLDLPFFKEEINADFEENKLIAKNLLEFRKKTKLLENLKKLYFEKVLKFADKIKLDKAFKSFDANSNGTITKTQMLSCLHHHEIMVSKEEIDEIYKKFDGNNNGKIEYNEFIVGVMDIQKIRRKSIFEELFYFLDSNSEGSITVKNFNNMLGFEKSEKRVKKILKNVIKKNEKMDIKEFQKIVDALISEYINE